MNLIFVEYFVVEFVVLIDDCVRYRRISSFGIGSKILFKNYQELSVLHVDEEIIGGLVLILHLSSCNVQSINQSSLLFQ